MLSYLLGTQKSYPTSWAQFSQQFLKRVKKSQKRFSKNAPPSSVCHHVVKYFFLSIEGAKAIRLSDKAKKYVKNYKFT